MKWKSSLLAIFSRVVRQMVTETHENDDYYDVTFVIIVFISFLPSIFMPWFFVHWILIGQIKTKGIRNILFHSVKGRNGNGANSQTGVHHSNTRKNKGKSKRRHLKILLKMIFRSAIYFVSKCNNYNPVETKKNLENVEYPKISQVLKDIL